MFKKIIYSLTALLFLVSFAHAGLNDRHSNIDLKRDNPQNTGRTKSGNRGWFYTIEDSDGDQSLYWDDKDGNINRVGGTKSYRLPIDLWRTTYSDVSLVQSMAAYNDSANSSHTSRAMVFTAGMFSTNDTTTSGAVAITAKAEEYRGAIRDDGLVSPAQVWFRVPDDFQENSTLVLTVQQFMRSNLHTTDAAIGLDYEYYTSAMGEAWSITPIRGTTVRLNGNSFVQEIVLTASLVAGNQAYFQIAPSPDIISRDELRIYDVQLLYD